MIKQLKGRFIRIAMISVVSVMVLLCLIINVANFISVDRELSEMLQTIQNNQGTLPLAPPDDNKPGAKPEGQFTRETPYATRYFVLRFDDAGVLSKADLNNIAAVTEDNVEEYLAIAVKKDTGYGYTHGYKYCVVRTGENRKMAIFLDGYQKIRACTMIAVLSLISMCVCIILVYIAVLLFSGRAIDPIVRSTERQKQFITDAGHELKTPITVITTSLKVLEMETGQSKWIDKIAAQTEKLKKLVNSLVKLSKIDENESPLTFADFPISDAVQETANSFTDFAQAAGRILNVSVTPNLTYHGDEYAVRQLVSVLLDNAVKYAPENTAITFSLKKEKKGVLITTENECQDPPAAEELEKLFDRFYRLDKARTDGGFGIGLSIARSIAEGHHGNIRAYFSAESPKTIVFSAHLK